MSTPTDPTTPQPKPADAAAEKAVTTNGVWFVSAASGLMYRSHHGAGSLRAVVVKGKYFYPKLPTPHVPNATVFACYQCGCDIHFAPFVGCEKCKPVAQLYRAEAKSAAAETVGTGEVDLLADVAEWFEEQLTEQCRCHGGGETCDFCTHASNVQRARARHRPAVETVGTGEGARALFEAVGLWLADRSRRGLMVQGELEENVIKAFKEYLATPPAVLPPAKGGDGV